MTTLSRRFWSLVEALALVAFIAMLVLVSAQIMFRYLLAISVPWTEEAARWFYAWQIFLGSALAMKRGLHLQVTFLLDRFPTGLRTAVELLIGLGSSIFCGGVAWGSLLMMRAVYTLDAGSFAVSTSFLYLAIPVSLVLMLWLSGAAFLRAGATLLRRVRG